MRRMFFVFFVFFTFSSCNYEKSNFRGNFKKEVKQSWAWKIFIFTDLGEFQSIESEPNKFDNINKEKTIFADDIWKINLNEDLFLKNHEVAFEEDSDYVNLEITKRKK